MGETATCVADKGLSGNTDADNIEWARRRDAILVTADSRILVRKHERAALEQAGISVIEFNFPNKDQGWERFRMMVNKWQEIKKVLNQSNYIIVRPKSIRTLDAERNRK